ncbi:helix-turn-helix transcriptional regulator [Breoghania sp. L-A4]|uniref:AraC family transcriptional regulator n=1 Tax=Breoghania sp. L-A4 TaxID=2304600 RepID=UPI000E35D02C|nr:helix-turn-helix transcriptional regulator [Breoghania sp. L-A4]AXS41238.1 AraC family transcriptional regulator [Breoghania sp. L-A4]
MIHPDVFTTTREAVKAPVIAYAGTQEKGSVNTGHSHPQAQLFHIVSGSVTVETRSGSFVVPPERALWMPPRMHHTCTYHQHSTLRYLYFRPELVTHLPKQPAVIRLSPLLRELALAFMAHPREYAEDGPAARLAAVIVDQLAAEPATPLHLPMPHSARLRKAIAGIIADPSSADSVVDVAASAALSQRSFERHFTAETHVSFRAWRKQARLMKAVEWLAQGRAVGEISDALGYEGRAPSSPRFARLSAPRRGAISPIPRHPVVRPRATSHLRFDIAQRGRSLNGGCWLQRRGVDAPCTRKSWSPLTPPKPTSPSPRSPRRRSFPTIMARSCVCCR